MKLIVLKLSSAKVFGSVRQLIVDILEHVLESGLQVVYLTAELSRDPILSFWHSVSVVVVQVFILYRSLSAVIEFLNQLHDTLLMMITLQFGFVRDPARALHKLDALGSPWLKQVLACSEAWLDSFIFLNQLASLPLNFVVDKHRTTLFLWRDRKVVLGHTRVVERSLALNYFLQLCDFNIVLVSDSSNLPQLLIF